MKGYTDFAAGFGGPEAIATKPIGKRKHMDWKKVQEEEDENEKDVL